MYVDYSKKSTEDLLHARLHKIEYLKNRHPSTSGRIDVADQLYAVEEELCRRGYVTLDEDIAKEFDILHASELQSPLLHETFEQSQLAEFDKLLFAID